MCEGEKENGRVRGRREERQRQGKDIILKLSLLNVGWEGEREREGEREGERRPSLAVPDTHTKIHTQARPYTDTNIIHTDTHRYF